MPIHTAPVSWQAEQPAVTPAWIWVPVGGGLANAVPGATSVALAAIAPDGMLAR